MYEHDGEQAGVADTGRKCDGDTLPDSVAIRIADGQSGREPDKKPDRYGDASLIADRQADAGDRSHSFAESEVKIKGEPQGSPFSISERVVDLTARC